MDTAELKVFEAVARTGGMNRAADGTPHRPVQRHRPHPRAGGWAGLLLFERHSRGVALTAAGERLLPYARRVAWLLADATRAARDDGTAARSADHRLP